MSSYGNFAANNVVGNYLSGRQAADQEHQANQMSRARDQQYQQNVLNQQQTAAATDEASQMKAAQQLHLASQYALQAPPGQTKAFVEQNFPDLVAHAGAKWATATEDDVRSELQGVAAQSGAQAGIAPTPAPVQFEQVKGPRGSIIQRNPVTNEQRQVIGPDNSQPVPTAGIAPKPPVGYRLSTDGASLEPIPGGPADPSVGKGKITDAERLSAAYATRMRKAADSITTLNYIPTTADMVKFNYMLGGPGITQSMANKTLSPEAQQYLQAVQDFNRAKLRKESGAAIGKEEVFGDLSTFFPVPGDDAKTLAQKQSARETAIDGMIGAAGPAYKTTPNRPPSPGPQQQSEAPPAAIQYLQAHPEAAPAFKAKYGYLP